MLDAGTTRRNNENDNHKEQHSVSGPSIRQIQFQSLHFPEMQNRIYYQDHQHDIQKHLFVEIRFERAGGQKSNRAMRKNTHHIVWDKYQQHGLPSLRANLHANSAGSHAIICRYA